MNRKRSRVAVTSPASTSASTIVSAPAAVASSSPIGLTIRVSPACSVPSPAGGDVVDAVQVEPVVVVGGQVCGAETDDDRPDRVVGEVVVGVRPAVRREGGR